MADQKKIIAMLSKDAPAEERYLAEFMPPSTWTPPDEAVGGREVEGVVSYKVKPDGTVCITKMGGVEADDGMKFEGEEEVEEDPMRAMMGGGY